LCKGNKIVCDSNGQFNILQGDPATPYYQPVDEICDGLDNNCNGTVDEGCQCTPNEDRSCGIDVGECAVGNQHCNAGQWESCTGQVDGLSETCNGKDDNCNGVTDEGFPDMIKMA
jgi:hypothetical protein